jgi:hypothetical protein
LVGARCGDCLRSVINIYPRKAVSHYLMTYIDVPSYTLHRTGITRSYDEGSGFWHLFSISDQGHPHIYNVVTDSESAPTSESATDSTQEGVARRESDGSA